MLTNYEFTKQRSAYHYDAQLMDPRWDCVRGLGKFQGDWQNYVPKAVQMSQIVNWANKRYTSESEESTGKNLEINDLLVQGLNPEHNVMHRVVYDLSPFPKWQKMPDLIGFDRCVAKLQIQLTGDCTNVHVDKMDFHYADIPKTDWDTIGRLIIMLTDWEPGQFMNFGNYNHSRWRAGEISTWDWRHVPHGTANSSLKPRVLMTVSGIKTQKSEEFFRHSLNVPYIEIM